MNKRIFLHFKKKNAGTSVVVSKKPEAACKAGVLVLFHIIFFAKTVDVYCIFNKIDHFDHFHKISGHPRAIFADARLLKFCFSYIARTIANIRSVSRLFPRVL